MSLPHIKYSRGLLYFWRINAILINVIKSFLVPRASSSIAQLVSQGLFVWKLKTKIIINSTIILFSLINITMWLLCLVLTQWQLWWPSIVDRCLWIFEFSNLILSDTTNPVHTFSRATVGSSWSSAVILMLTLRGSKLAELLCKMERSLLIIKSILSTLLIERFQLMWCFVCKKH